MIKAAPAECVREPYAAATTDHTGCVHIGAVEGIEAIAAAGAKGPTEVVYLYEGPTPAPQPHVGGEIPAHVRDFLGKVQGVCMGVAMSGRDHPNPDGVLMDLFNEAQEILFPAALATEGK